MSARTSLKPRGEVLVDSLGTVRRTGRGVVGGWTNPPVTTWWGWVRSPVARVACHDPFQCL